MSPVLNLSGIGSERRQESRRSRFSDFPRARLIKNFRQSERKGMNADGTPEDR